MRGGPCGTPRNVSLPRTMAIRSSRDTAATLAADSTDDPNSGDRLDRDRHLLSGGEDGGDRRRHPRHHGFALAGGAAVIIHGIVDRGADDLDLFGADVGGVARLAHSLTDALRAV